MNERRVVVTGMGVVTPIGSTIETFWQGLVEGKSGISLYSAFDSTAHDCKIAGELKDFEPAPFFKNANAIRHLPPRRSSVFCSRNFSPLSMTARTSGLSGVTA